MTGGVSWEASLGRSIGGGFSPEMSAKLVPQADKYRLYPGISGVELEDTIFGDLVVLSGSRYVATAMHAVHAVPHVCRAELRCPRNLSAAH